MQTLSTESGAFSRFGAFLFSNLWGLSEVKDDGPDEADDSGSIDHKELERSQIMTSITTEPMTRVAASAAGGVKRILVHYDATPRGDRALTLALSLADRHDAHIIGYTVHWEPHVPTYAASHLPPELMESLIKEQEKVAKDVRTAFEHAVDAAGRAHRCEFQTGKGDPAEDMISLARGCDIIVVGQAERGKEAAEIEELPETLVMDSGRPVLLAPYIGEAGARPGSAEGGVSEHVLLCWTDTKESARAMSEALPVMTGATKVTVLTVATAGGKDAQTDAVPGEDAARYLAAHGVDAELRRIVATNIDVGTAILNEAADIGASMIVMGAYGHSRLRETVLGGTTKTILHEMTAPVLMAH